MDVKKLKEKMDGAWAEQVAGKEEITVILPAYNEEQAIGRVIDEIRSLPIECKILVGDNASTDMTQHIAWGKGVELFYIQEKGKGNVIKVLLRHVDTPYVVMVNADYTYPLSYAMTIHQLLSLSRADVVMGYRNIKEKDSMTLTNSLGNWCLSLLASILYGKRVYDVCTGMWGFKTDGLKKFSLTSEGFTLEADLFTNVIKNKCRVEQIPIAYRARLDGSKTKLKVRDGFKIAWFLIKRRFRWNI